MPVALQKVDEHGADVYFEWYAEGQIVVYRSRATGNFGSREKVDAWIDNALEIVQNWDVSQPYLSIVDTENSASTPYAIKRAEEFYTVFPDGMTGRIAVVIPPSPLYQIMKITTDRSLKRALPNIERAIFRTLDEALDWVALGLPESS